MSSPPSNEDVALIRCPGCGRSTLGTIPRCTHCKMELGVRGALPPVKNTAATADQEQCALCGQNYDASAHQACPNCAERFGHAKREALEAHDRGRKLGELAVWSAAAAGLTAIGGLALWGANVVAPTFSTGSSLWTVSFAGGLGMGLVAGWRLRERTAIYESVVAVVGVAAAATVWLHAAIIWANGFNLTAPVVEHRCDVLAHDGEAATLRCAAGGDTIEGVVAYHGPTTAPGTIVTQPFRPGRFGYWVALGDAARPLPPQGDEETP